MLKENKNEKTKDYICLLSEELTELSGVAWSHGWRSSRWGEGIEKRKELQKYADKFGSVI